MNQQRVSIVEGKNPVLIIAPSGPNDKNTDFLAETIATEVNCYAVINWGWQRSQNLDFHNDKADCNNINHLRGVVYDEFLEPILRFKNRITKKHKNVYQFILQGVAGNDLPGSVDAVLGEGPINSPSCNDWFRNIFIYLASQEGLHTYMAKPGSALAGAAKKNLNQLFSEWYPDTNVQSAQIEIVLGLRETKMDVEICGNFFANTVKKLLSINRTQVDSILPYNFRPSSL